MRDGIPIEQRSIHSPMCISAYIIIHAPLSILKYRTNAIAEIMRAPRLKFALRRKASLYLLHRGIDAVSECALHIYHNSPHLLFSRSPFPSPAVVIKATSRETTSADYLAIQIIGRVRASPSSFSLLLSPTESFSFSRSSSRVRGRGTARTTYARGE